MKSRMMLAKELAAVLDAYFDTVPEGKPQVEEIRILDDRGGSGGYRVEIEVRGVKGVEKDELTNFTYIV